MTTARFEEGKTYYKEWALGRATYTVVRRTACMITLSNGRKYRLHETWSDREQFAKQEYINIPFNGATVSLYAENIEK